MTTLVDYLKLLDLSDTEAKLYLMLLKNGPTSVRDLSQTVAIKRTTAYFYIDALVEKGLMIKLVRGSKKLVAATEPKNLIMLVEEKLKNAEAIQHDFPKMLKMIAKSIPPENKNFESGIKYYKGKNGVKNIFEDILQAKEIRSFANITEFTNVFPEGFHLIDTAIKKNTAIKFTEILEDTPQTKHIVNDALQNTNNRYQCKYFPAGMKISSSDITIYDEKVSFINMRDNIHGLIIPSPLLYENFKTLFDFIWKALPNTN